MKINNAYKRLFSLWGLIDRQHNQLIYSRISGKRVLDIGCGYGSLVDFLTRQGLNAEGIDSDKESYDIAQELFHNPMIRLIDAEHLEEFYRPGAIDTITLKDVLHHLAGEGDAHSAFQQFHRILRNNGRIVILDPNPIWILKTARKIIKHDDPEADLDVAISLLKQSGFLIKGIEFFEVIGLPLSGGYVGLRLVPNWKPLNTLVATINKELTNLINKLNLGRYLCWRYMVYAEKKI